MIGGYLILDFGGFDFISGGGSESFPGLHEKMKKAKKPILLKNVSLNGVAYEPFFCQYMKTEEGDFSIVCDPTLATYLQVTKTDEVSLEEAGS